MTANFSIKDFTKEKCHGNYNIYILKKECIIFGKIFEEEPLRLSIHKNQSLSSSISKINEYINWLGANCKETLINELPGQVGYYSSVTTDELIKNKWYELLKVNSVILGITEKGKMGGDIYCDDNYDGTYILEIGLEEKEIDYIDVVGVINGKMDPKLKNTLLDVYGSHHEEALEEYCAENNIPSCQALIKEFDSIHNKIFSYLWDITEPNKKLTLSEVQEETKSFCSKKYPWIDETGLKALHYSLRYNCWHEGLLAEGETWKRKGE